MSVTIAGLVAFDCMLIFASLLIKLRFCRGVTFFTFIFLLLQKSLADVNDAKVDVVGDSPRSAILEIRQQNPGGNDKEIVALLLNGRYSTMSVTGSATGELVKLPEGSCNGGEDDFTNQITSEWIGILTLDSPSMQQSSDASTSQNLSDSQTVLDRVKKAMLLGASAIIILALNPKILQELDIAQILTKPLVFVEDMDNVTVLLNALKSKMKLKMRIIFGSSSVYDTQTFTVWSACWRARPGSDVVCRSDHKLSKADPNLFWSYFYSAIAVAILLLMLKTNYRSTSEEGFEDSQAMHTIARIALSLLKTRRYKNKTCRSMDSDGDACAICLDQFYRRQILRVLPCLHEFHSKCVDQWLLSHQTCPLCKSNILEFQINEGLISQRLFSRFT